MSGGGGGAAAAFASSTSFCARVSSRRALSKVSCACFKLSSAFFPPGGGLFKSCGSRVKPGSRLPGIFELVLHGAQLGGKLRFSSRRVLMTVSNSAWRLERPSPHPGHLFPEFLEFLVDGPSWGVPLSGDLCPFSHGWSSSLGQTNAWRSLPLQT